MSEKPIYEELKQSIKELEKEKAAEAKRFKKVLSLSNRFFEISNRHSKKESFLKEIVTEVRGAKDGKTLTYRLGTLTCKGALPTGVAPARTALWLAEGSIPPGVYPPEAAIDPEPFFKELEEREIYTQVSVTGFL